VTRLAAFALEVAALLAVAACSHVAVGPLMPGSAGTKTLAAGTFRLTIVSRSTAKGNGHEISGESTIEGLEDLPHSATQVTSAATGFGQPPSHAATITIGPDRWVSQTVLPTSKPWTHARTINGAALPASFGPLDPLKVLGDLQATGARFVVLGTEAVRGTTTTHYRATLPPTAVPTDDPLVASAYGFEVWIDRDDIVRRLRTVFSGPLSQGAPQTPSVSVENTVELYDFGFAASIQPPPPDQVEEASQSFGP